MTNAQLASLALAFRYQRDIAPTNDADLNAELARARDAELCAAGLPPLHVLTDVYEQRRQQALKSAA